MRPNMERIFSDVPLVRNFLGFVPDSSRSYANNMNIKSLVTGWLEE
jgi:hypothetical protein